MKDKLKRLGIIIAALFVGELSMTAVLFVGSLAFELLFGVSPELRPIMFLIAGPVSCWVAWQCYMAVDRVPRSTGRLVFGARTILTAGYVGGSELSPDSIVFDFGALLMVAVSVYYIVQTVRIRRVPAHLSIQRTLNSTNAEPAEFEVVQPEPSSCAEVAAAEAAATEVKPTPRAAAIRWPLFLVAGILVTATVAVGGYYVGESQAQARAEVAQEELQAQLTKAQRAADNRQEHLNAAHKYVSDLESLLHEQADNLSFDGKLKLYLRMDMCKKDAGYLSPEDLTSALA